ncbi:MAG: type II secretion system GspH family protein, partial [Puniceicoccales bacterium]|nr:type II secretion system GspH family protein [Puniceicoccales bacterium]
MRQGFSLLEVILAIGILGLSLPILLIYMAESAGKTERRIQEILVVNAGENVQNVLSVVNGAPILDDNNRAYCGYKGGIFTIANTAMNFDGSVFVLCRKSMNSLVNESVEETTYALYPWDNKNQSPRLTLPYVEVRQYVVVVSLGTTAWINKVVLGNILGMQEGQAKQKAAWSYASVTHASYEHTKIYGSSQIFEYTSYINRNYSSSIVGNDTVAQTYGQELYSSLTTSNNSRLSNWDKLKQDPILGNIMSKTMDA